MIVIAEWWNVASAVTWPLAYVWLWHLERELKDGRTLQGSWLLDRLVTSFGLALAWPVAWFLFAATTYARLTR